LLIRFAQIPPTADTLRFYKFQRC